KGDDGGILYIEGPSAGTVARLRSAAMNATKNPAIPVTAIRGDWTEQGGYRAVMSWLTLSTSRRTNLRVVGCQNDAMAMGARKAFEEISNSDERNQWLGLSFTGVDGLPGTGQRWVKQGLLAATVITPPHMGVAIQLLHDAMGSGSHP